MIVSVLSSAEAGQPFEKLDCNNFKRPTIIDNAWYPIKPGMSYTWDGYAVDEEGDEEKHSVVFEVTDLVKEISGVRTVVCWDRDFVDKEMEEAEIMFLAQDNNGAVWLLGEYPEEYSNKKFEKQSCWIDGFKDGHAGILVKKDLRLGDEYSEGWAPSVEYSDHALVYKVGQHVTTPAGKFDDVVVVDESNQETVGAHHLKYYSRGIGCVHIGWRGKETDQEIMDLYKFGPLSAEELAKADEAASNLEKHAYVTSKDVYAKTHPSERNSLIHTKETKLHN